MPTRYILLLISLRVLTKLCFFLGMGSELHLDVNLLIIIKIEENLETKYFCELLKYM